MKKIKRIIAIIICFALAASLCACGGENSVNTTVAEDDMSKHVELKWMIRVAQPEGFDEVMAAANEYLNEKLNVTLDLQCIEPADFGKKAQLALASGENIDIIWTSNWGGFEYESNVAKNAFMPLDDFLELPELSALKNYYSEGIWDATRVSGKIYGIPVEQIFHTQHGYTFKADIAKKYGLEDRIRAMAWVDEETHGTMAELEEIYDIVRAGEPSDFVISTSGVLDTFLPYASKVDNYEVVDYKVVDTYERGLERAKRARRWGQKGYFPADIATLDNVTMYENEGKVFSLYYRYLPGVEGKWRIGHSYDVICIPTSEAVIDRAGIHSTLNGIALTCKNPVRALKLLHLMHTDEYLLNLLSYGLEGRDYTKDPTNPKRMERDSDAFYIPEYLIGSQFLAYLAPTYEDGVWEQTKKENETARIDDLIGFSFDPSAVESEMSQVAAVRKEYSRILNNGLDDPEIVYPELESKLKLAGKQTIVDEIQNQIDQWLESK